MPVWIQHLLVALIVLACATFVVWQIARTLGGRRSRAGACCSKGCGPEQRAKPQAASQRVVFMPVEMLGRRK